MVSTDSMFPDLLGETVGEPIESDHMSYEAFATAIYTMTRLAAACALAGDLPMGRAFVHANNALVSFAMERWPNVPTESVEEQVRAAAVQLRHENQPPKPDVESNTVRIVLICDADERRSFQLNDSVDFVNVDAGNEHELHVPAGTSLTVKVSAGNSFQPSQEPTGEKAALQQEVDPLTGQNADQKANEMGNAQSGTRTEHEVTGDESVDGGEKTT